MQKYVGGNERDRYIRPKTNDRINKKTQDQKYLTIGPKMQKSSCMLQKVDK